MTFTGDRLRAGLLALLLAPALAGAQTREDLLDLHHGAVILAHTGEYSDDFPANALIDGSLDYFWSSKRRLVSGFHGDSMVIELDRRYLVDTLVVDNRQNDESAYPGISAREVRFSASVVSPTGPWQPMTVVEGQPFDRAEQTLPQPVEARWIKVEVLSNHGNADYTEITELEAYGRPLESPPEMQVDGIYQTDYGPLLLQSRGDEVEGCYEIDGGYVYGTIQGRTLNLNWIEHRGEERGTAVLAFSSHGLFNGLWYVDGELQGGWYGTRQSDEADIGCDPVTAAADVNFKSGKLAGK